MSSAPPDIKSAMPGTNQWQMTPKQTLYVAVLTAIYLCFELAFNARLLDVVGSAASTDQIHSIEVFGRALSGVAVALLVLQFLLGMRNRLCTGSPDVFEMVFWCLCAGALVYFLLQLLVNHLVERSSAEFRRTSLNLVLVQRALVDGSVELDGLGDDPGLFAKPAGKAFLAMFPVMAVSVDQLDEKISDAKPQMISRQISERFEGAGGFHKKYLEAVDKTAEQWKQYQRIPSAQALVDRVAREQDAAWNKYISDLGRRGWTPSSVPAHARNTVRRQVMKSAGVSNQWNLTDEASFRAAVERKVRRKAGNPKGSAGLMVKGQRIPPGLSWPAFFAHNAVQAELREALNLPKHVRLKHDYASIVEFDREVFSPMVLDTARRELARYDAPAESFQARGDNVRAGVDAARAAIVPPLALFFSLLGAVGHLAKLTYLLLRLGATAIPAFRERARHLWLAPVAVLAIAWTGLSQADNSVTRSRLHNYMIEQVIANGGAGSGLLVNTLHVVAVGQGYGYPINEAVRTHVLGGITFGYREPNASN